MHFKLIVAFVDDSITDDVMSAAREAGATGITLVGSARGEGIEPEKTFFGLSLSAQREMLLMVVEEHLSRHILEALSEAGGFEEKPGRGIALKLDVEDVIGVNHQMSRLVTLVEDEL